MWCTISYIISSNKISKLKHQFFLRRTYQDREHIFGCGITGGESELDLEEMIKRYSISSRKTIIELTELTVIKLTGQLVKNVTKGESSRTDEVLADQLAYLKTKLSLDDTGEKKVHEPFDPEIVNKNKKFITAISTIVCNSKVTNFQMLNAHKRAKAEAMRQETTDIIKF